jgi:hypothetical protein
MRREVKNMSIRAVAEADPRRPYKAYGTLVVTFLGLLWANLEGRETWGSLGFQDWATIVVPTILATAAVYGIRNPKAGETAG